MRKETRVLRRIIIMTRISLRILGLSIFTALSIQTASAQLPKIKIPKPKPQPTPTEDAEPTPSREIQPSQPQPDKRNTAKPAASGGNSAAQEGQPTVAKDSPDRKSTRL